MPERRLTGFSTPRTGSGRSALVEPPPHHISCDALHVAFRADPARIAPLLPPGLEPAADGSGWAMIADMVKVSAADPDRYWRSPERCNYNEGLVGFNVTLDGRQGRITPFVWVDRDWSLVMGQIFGWGKRLARVSRTRFNPVNPGLPALGPGATARGVVEREGRTVLDLTVRIPQGAAPLDRLPAYGDTTFLYRYLASPGPGIAEVEQLLELPLSNVAMADIWGGEGQLAFGSADNEELGDLGAVEVTGGFLYKRGWTTAAEARLVIDYADRRAKAAE